METIFLRCGDAGPLVMQLQQALLNAGFSPGAVDGAYGAGTEAAVLALQRSRGLLVDGIAGPRTQAALDLIRSPALPDTTERIDAQLASRMCPHSPLANIKAHLPPVLQALRERSLGDRLMSLMAIATIRAEAESFKPVSEEMSRYNTSPGGEPFDLYDHRRDLGNTGNGDGARFRGRGFVQLTGRYNYGRYGALLKEPVNLLLDPEAANEPAIAAELLALFLQDRERQIKQALVDGELRAARRLVNGGSHGLTRFTEAFQRGCELVPA